MRVNDPGLVELSHQLMDLLGAANQRAEGQFVIWALFLDFGDFVRVGSTEAPVNNSNVAISFSHCLSGMNSKPVPDMAPFVKKRSWKSHLPDGLEHAAHAAHKTDLLL